MGLWYKGNTVWLGWGTTNAGNKAGKLRKRRQYRLHGANFEFTPSTVSALENMEEVKHVAFQSNIFTIDLHDRFDWRVVHHLVVAALWKCIPAQSEGRIVLTSNIAHSCRVILGTLAVCVPVFVVLLLTLLLHGK